MRVLVVTQHFAPEQNAPSFRWSWLTKGLTDRNVTVDVLTAAWDPDATSAQESPSLRVHRVQNVFRGTGLAPRLLNELIVARRSIMLALRLPRPDVVIVTAPPLGAMLYARPLAWLLRRPLVLDLRDAWPELLDEWRTWSDYGNGPSPHLLRDAATAAAIAVFRPMMLAVRRSADLVVTTTRTYAEWLRAQGARQVIHIRNSTGATPRVPHRDFDGQLRVLYIGNVGRAQLLATAVRAAATVKQAGGNMVLRIVGQGAHLVALQRLAEQLDAPVEFLAKVPHSEVARHYRWADSLLLMLRNWSAMSMTVPSKLYEMIATGKHISASVAGESAAIVRDTGAGDVVHPQDPDALAALWLALLEEPARLRREHTSDWVAEHVNPMQLSGSYLDALKALLRRSKAAA